MIQHMPGRESHTFVARQPTDVKAIVIDADHKIIGMNYKLSSNARRDTKCKLIGAELRPDRYIG